MNAAVPVQLRPYQPDDAEACLALFRGCVHRVNIRDYAQEQVDAWAPPNIDSAAWTSRFNNRLAYVAVEDDRVIGFSDMTREGHLDRLFVSADHQGRGIARLLVETLFRDALAYGIDEITTDASITAKPSSQSSKKN